MFKFTNERHNDVDLCRSYIENLALNLHYARFKHSDWLKDKNSQSECLVCNFTK